MINETFHCHPPIAKNYQQFAPKEASTTKNCLAEGVCMFQLSTRFCQAPFCWADNAPKSQCKRQCQNPVSVSFLLTVTLRSVPTGPFTPQICMSDIQNDFSLGNCWKRLHMKLILHLLVISAQTGS